MSVCGRFGMFSHLFSGNLGRENRKSKELLLKGEVAGKQEKSDSFAHADADNELSDPNTHFAS